MEGKAEKVNQENQEERGEDVDLTQDENERALIGAYRSFVISGAPKTDTDSYFDQTKPHIKMLIKIQLKEMGSTNIIMILWVKWKKPIMPLIELDPEDVESAQDLDGNTGDNCTRVEMPFNSLMTEFFEGSYINDLMQCMLAHIKTQVENLRMPENSFTLNKIMHLYINFQRLELTRVSSYIELPEWIKRKKAVIYPQNKNE